ncbi:MAG: hypothetical protein LKF88_00490 [Microbacteriaceae bacterium]|jgi:hypothetical protein|nr:hypothetical protein [Microbacteriaceae bacterium]MCI1207706.1 hypothetical protein [Microbacteriaceae bacterium]
MDLMIPDFQYSVLVDGAGSLNSCSVPAGAIDGAMIHKGDRSGGRHQQMCMAPGDMWVPEPDPGPGSPSDLVLPDVQHLFATPVCFGPDPGRGFLNRDRDDTDHVSSEHC